MKAKDFIKKLKKLKKNQKLVLGIYEFYKKNNLYYVFNNQTKIIENINEPFTSAEETRFIYMGVVRRFEEKPKSKNESIFYSAKFKNDKEKIK